MVKWPLCRAQITAGLGRQEGWTAGERAEVLASLFDPPRDLVQDSKRNQRGENLELKAARQMRRKAKREAQKSEAEAQVDHG